MHFLMETLFHHVFYAQQWLLFNSNMMSYFCYKDNLFLLLPLILFSIITIWHYLLMVPYLGSKQFKKHYKVKGYLSQ